MIALSLGQPQLSIVVSVNTVLAWQTDCSMIAKHDLNKCPNLTELSSGQNRPRAHEAGARENEAGM